MELKVHIEDHRDLLMGGALALVGIVCLVVTKREINTRLDEMQSNITKAIYKSRD